MRNRSKNATYEERERAVKNFLKGESAVTIARNIGRDRKTIYKWVKVYEKKKSFEDLKEKSRPGRPRKIDSKIIKKLEKSPREARFKVWF